MTPPTNPSARIADAADKFRPLLEEKIREFITALERSNKFSPREIKTYSTMIENCSTWGFNEGLQLADAYLIERVRELEGALERVNKSPGSPILWCETVMQALAKHKERV